jgi:hypothetical protein
MASFNISDLPFLALYPEVEAPPKPEIEPPLPPQSNASNASNAYHTLTLPPLASYPSREALFEAIQIWAKPRGYAFTVGKSKLQGQRRKVYYACDKNATPPLSSTTRIRDTQTRGTKCPFSILAVELPQSLGWELRYRPGTIYNTHNHPPSQSPAAHPSHRHLSVQALATSQNLFLSG